MTKTEKDNLKLKLGLSILKVIQENKLSVKEKKDKGNHSIGLIDSLRKLEASSGIPYASIHRIVVGEKNASFTTLALLVEGLNLDIADFFKRYYQTITENDIDLAVKKKNKKKD